MKLFFAAHVLSPVSTPPPTAHFSVEFQTTHAMPSHAISQAQMRRTEDLKIAVATEQFSRLMPIKRDIATVANERFDHFLQVLTDGLDEPKVYFIDKEDLGQYMRQNDWSKIQDQAIKEFNDINATGIKPRQPLLIRVQNEENELEQPPRKMSRGQSDSDMMF